MTKTDYDFLAKEIRGIMAATSASERPHVRRVFLVMTGRIDAHYKNFNAKQFIDAAGLGVSGRATSSGPQ